MIFPVSAQDKRTKVAVKIREACKLPRFKRNDYNLLIVNAKLSNCIANYPEQSILFVCALFFLPRENLFLKIFCTHFNYKV